jgi:hypothetical protein
VAAVILAAAAAGGLLLSACGGSSDSASATQAAGALGGRPPDMSSLFAEALDPLVADGTITSDQERAVIDALGTSGPGGAQGQAGQPSPGATLPSGQAPSTGATPPGGRQGSAPGSSQMFGSALDGLVRDGTITSSQRTAIGEALSSATRQAAHGQQESSTG